MKAVAILFGLDTADWDWNKARQMIKDPGAFKRSMIKYNIRGVTNRMIYRLQRFEKSSLNQPGSAKQQSEAVHVIWSWVSAIAIQCGI